jgi:hypothetical protein
MWDAVVRGTGATGLLGIGRVRVLPASGPLVGLGVSTLWISGPLSPLFPVGLEPVPMLFGRLYPPWLVAAVSASRSNSSATISTDTWPAGRRRGRCAGVSTG